MNICPPTCPANDAQIFSLAGILPADPHQSRADQARDVFARMADALAGEGMTFAHVARTWFYLDNILDWYGEFNALRTAFFTEQHVFQGIVPASTGVGMRNPQSAALMGGLLAVKPGSPQVNVMAVPSPLQCPALNYRSGFSRAVEVEVPGRRHLYISGTASIDLHGASVYCGDVRGQIARTMSVVDALLQSRGMTWNTHVTRAVAYFPDLQDAPHFAGYCQAHALTERPVTTVEATICRQDLLFEIELDAVAARDETSAHRKNAGDAAPRASER